MIMKGFFIDLLRADKFGRSLSGLSFEGFLYQLQREHTENTWKDLFILDLLRREEKVGGESICVGVNTFSRFLNKTSGKILNV